MLVVGNGAGAVGTGLVVVALDHGVAIDFVTMPAIGDGDGGGAVFAGGDGMEESECHFAGIQKDYGDLVAAAAGYAQSVPNYVDRGMMGVHY